MWRRKSWYNRKRFRIEVKNPDGESEKDLIHQKIKITLNTTAFDLIEKMNKKVSIMKEYLSFESKKMILKVRSLNDYIFDIVKPMILFIYKWMHKA